MLSVLMVCLTTFCVSDSGTATQPAAPVQATEKQPSAAKPAQAQPTETAQPSKPAEAKKPVKSEPKGSPDKQKSTSGPQVYVVNRPQTDPPKAEPKSDLLAIEQNVVDCTNAERARYGLPALEVDTGLMATARQHCAWMTINRQMVHTNLAVAENIAMGQPSSQDVVRCWMNSSGHRANILNGGHRHIGVSAYTTPEGTIYWCQQFMP
jgi:uncharacterized protein YkwD